MKNGTETLSRVGDIVTEKAEDIIEVDAVFR